MNALLLIDIQNDFLPGGSLAVAEGDEIIPVVNALQKNISLVIATQDWHPANHGSFASVHKGKKPGDIIELDGVEQVLWPDHCIQDSEGAEFAYDLETGKVTRVFKKGTDPKIDSYSGFFDNRHKRSTGLHDFLLEKRVTSLALTGLAADICVRYTALDALELGYETYVVRDAVKAVSGKEAYDNTMKTLEEKGAKIITSEEFMKIMQHI